MNIKEYKYDKNKSISENKYNTPKKNININKNSNRDENIINKHYLLYSDLPLGVPQNVKDIYKLYKTKKNNTPDPKKKVEYLRTYIDDTDFE